MSSIRHETLACSGTWRLLSFGKWKFHRQIRQEPVIQVTLGEIYGPGAGASKAARLTGEVRDCELPVGELPPLHINAILSDGRIQAAPNLAPPTEHLLRTPESLDFSHANCRIITRDHRDWTGNVVIPRRRKLFELRDARETLFLAIGKGSDPYARIVPCMEIVRFFYAPSTGMSRAVFSEAFTKPAEALWNPAKCCWDRARGHVHLHLRKSRMDADARFLAYFYTQPVALERAAHIFKRVAAGAAARGYGGAQAVQAFAPLEGQAPARYRYIPIGVAGRERRFITRFHAVDLPVAFHSLAWTRDGDSRSTPDRRYAPPKPGNPPPRPLDDERPPEECNVTDDPQERELPPRRTVFNETEFRFRTLCAVPAQKSEKHTQHVRTKGAREVRADTGNTTTLAAGGRDTGSRRTSLESDYGRNDDPSTSERPIDEEDIRRDASDPFHTLVDKLLALRALEGVTVEFLPVLARRFPAGPVVYNAFDAKYTGEERYAPHVGAWYFSDDSGSPRLLVAAEVRVETPSGARFYYLIDMQARKGRREGLRLVRMPGCARITPDRLARALGKLPGRQALSIALSGALVRSQRHVGAFAKDADPERLLAAVMEKLGDSAPLSKAAPDMGSPFFEVS